ncbi:hypothetical protein NDU88_004153 [Pleurodeles waltl]|uniref:Uncharacterized protein n=1 Tax=Pleurodeles waltl TaxID=8319 RepID=A0AAV7PC33_PLEWA|nr:hypothetical protein NDU88_004153 [Pleurodeles waltl]
MELELINFNNLTKVEMQTLCKERGLNVNKKASKVDLQVAVQDYEKVKKMQAAASEDDEGDLGPNENEDQDREEKPELQGKPSCPQEENQYTWDAARSSVSSRGLSEVE